jgi:Asp-tRNA(Asn)/Glu-tRNA(Gln) amidotransferase A subunit family amidase
MTLGWTYDRLGPMCRYAEDCAMVMSVIAKPDGRDMSVSDIPFNWNPSRYDLRQIRIGVTGMESPTINPNAQIMMDTLKKLGATLIPLTIPNPGLPQISEGFTYEQGAFFDELVRSGRISQMTNPGRGNGFKSARLMNVVDYLQSQRIRTMMMMSLAKATAGIDVYFSAAGGGGGNRGGGGGRGDRGAAPGGAPPAAGRGGRGGGGGGGAGGTGNTNSAGYPGVNVVVSFSEATEAAPAGVPASVVLYAPPFKETQLLFVAKSFQDAAQLHTRKPVLRT